MPLRGCDLRSRKTPAEPVAHNLSSLVESTGRVGWGAEPNAIVGRHLISEYFE